MDIRETAINRAVSALNNLGCKVLVQTPQGAVIGDLDHFAGKPPRKRITDRFEAYRVKETLESMKVGEVQFFPLIDGTDVTVDMLQRNISSHAGKIFGTGGYVTVRREHGVEVLRAI